MTAAGVVEDCTAYFAAHDKSSLHARATLARADRPVAVLPFRTRARVALLVVFGLVLLGALLGL